jgi:hypothetical protein
MPLSPLSLASALTPLIPMPNRKALIECDDTLALEVCVDGIPEPKGSPPVVEDDREDACLSIYHRMR